MNVALNFDQKPQLRVIEAPAAPRSIPETGLDEGFLVDLLCKVMYRQGLERPTDIARAICLPVPIIDELLEMAKQTKLVETLGQLGASMRAEMRWALSGKGREWALDALSQSEYNGPAPVTIRQFTEQVRRQSVRAERLSEEMLRSVFRDLTLSQELMEDIGPAVNSYSAILLYGPPGNGKSSISNAVCAAFRDHIYIPHAIVVERSIIVLYDPTVHTALSMGSENSSDGSVLRRDAGIDRRYVACKRPALTTGGELTLDMLDLSYNPTSRVYEAPMQLKASGGIFVVDDFGRQRQTPQELMNRLIIPLEAGVDYLSLQTGRKFQLPFDTLVMFSTNIAPSKLVDEAALRRLRYKILVDSPQQEDFLKILAHTARKFGLELTDEAVHYILFELYAKTPGAKFQGFHPRFLCDQIMAMSIYKGVKPQFAPEFLERAWANLFYKH